MKQLFCIGLLAIALSSSGQVGIGTNTPDQSAALEVSASGKGLLLPRVALTSTMDLTTIVSPATSLMVYNTATAGSGNTAVAPGYYYWDSAKWVAFRASAAASGWALAGNSATTPGTDFIGTTDAQDLVFKVNSQRSGLINSASYNTSLGYMALSAANGSGNTAVGTYSQRLKSGSFGNTSVGSESLSAAGGSRNTAVGSSALYNNTAFDNVAVGYQALFTNGTGQNNTGIGFQALYSNTFGTGNTALGNSALYSNVSGFSNVAIGDHALYTNAAGSSNNAVGEYALQVNTASYNNAFGFNSMKKNTSGSLNCAFGHQSLQDNTTGMGNSGFGLNALSDNIDGEYNTAVGSNTLGGNHSGSYNSAFGNQALSSNYTGSRNVALGALAGYGYNGSDMLFIDNQQRDNGSQVMEQSLLVGKFDADPDNQFITVNGALIINNGTGTAGNASLPGNDGYKLPITRGIAGAMLTSNGDGTTSWGPAKSPITTISNNSVADVADGTILIDAGLRNVIITLPDAAGNTGGKLIIKRIDNSAQTVMVTASGAQTIDGVGSFNLQAWQAFTLQSNGTDWYIIAH